GRDMSGISTTPVEGWLQSGTTVRLAGFDWHPVAHPLLPCSPQCVVKGQATVFFLRQHPHGNIWLLKKFHPGRRPSDEYLTSVNRCLPGGVGVFTCTQRRFIDKSQVDGVHSQYKNPDLFGWLEGTVLMPKCPGMPWVCRADDLRNGDVAWAADQRLRTAMNLARIIDWLETRSIAHRDLSATNVFVGDDGRVYLIDFDCVYHPSLPWQLNTTVGTPGYMAPFLRAANGEWDGVRSWRTGADRFSLSILASEFLLIDPQTSSRHEDGTLFAQSHLNSKGHEHVQRQIAHLAGIDRGCADLLRRTMEASDFDACPKPGEWVAGLRRPLSRHNSPQPESGRPAPWVDAVCHRCDACIRIPPDRFEELKARHKPLLCRPCLQEYLQEQTASRLRRDEQYPEIVCERCMRPARMPRDKLDNLRARGKPILCSQCLKVQLAVWQAEAAQHAAEFPRTLCSRCSKPVRVPRTKLDYLRSAGKAVLCLDCLDARSGRARSTTHSPS
ncbi:MAG: protein kinase, partial [Sedimentisphaerales bacterium]|nr:protein kinase [Sedimentisphaerales bacterium]